MGIHNSFGLSRDWRVVNHHILYKHHEGFYDCLCCFGCRCQLREPATGLYSDLPSWQPSAFTHEPLLTGSLPWTCHVNPAAYLIKREAESPYHIKTKVVNAKTGTDQETEVKVDTQGNGFSYQHIQQEDVLQRNIN